MGFFNKLFGGGIAEPINAIGSVFDKLFTSDEEREKANFVLEKLRQRPQELQAEINKIEANHKSVFVAGWRPFIGWVCGLGVGINFVVNPLIQWYTGHAGPQLPTMELFNLVLALLGMGGLRTYEKFKGVSREK